MEAKEWAIRCDYIGCLKPFTKPPLRSSVRVNGKIKYMLYFCHDLPCDRLTEYLLNGDFITEIHWRERGPHGHKGCGVPYRCRSCGHEFSEEKRYPRYLHCPECKKTSIEELAPWWYKWPGRYKNIIPSLGEE